jgi:hypothetical protein
LFNLLAAVSLVMCVAIAVLSLAGRTGQSTNTNAIPLGETKWFLRPDGILRGETDPWPSMKPLPTGRQRTTIKERMFSDSGIVLTRVRTEAFGPAYHNDEHTEFETHYAFIRYTPLLVVLMIPLGAWLIDRGWQLRMRRLAERIGHCPVCNYDLRASKERCPECGTAIPETMNAER